MGRGKANAISTEFAAALQEAALKAQEDPAVRGVVLTSRLAEDFLRRVRPEAVARQRGGFRPVRPRVRRAFFRLVPARQAARRGADGACGCRRRPSGGHGRLPFCGRRARHDRVARRAARDSPAAPLHGSDPQHGGGTDAHALGAPRRDDAVREAHELGAIDRIVPQTVSSTRRSASPSSSAAPRARSTGRSSATSGARRTRGRRTSSPRGERPSSTPGSPRPASAASPLSSITAPDSRSSSLRD